MPRQIYLLLLCLLGAPSLAAQSTAAERYRQQQVVRSLRFPGKGAPSAQFFDAYRSVLGTSEWDHWQKMGEWTDAGPLRHRKYQQYYRGLPVVGARYTLHHQNGIVRKATGRIAPLLDLPVAPNLDQASLLRQAVVQLERSLVREERLAPDQSLDWQWDPPRLVIVDPRYPQRSGTYVLAYELVLRAERQLPLIEVAYYDAHSGQLLLHHSRVQSETVPARGRSFYYGAVNFRSDSLGRQQYRLVDDSRGIATVNGAPERTEDQFTDTDNYWEATAGDYQTRVAVDAHWCSTAYFDFMRDQFAWEGVDGQGMELNTVVNVGGRFFTNAYWNGSSAFFGNGDCSRFNPLTTLDVVGHEFAHGFTNFTSDLVYRNQSGALNESISDILGKALEAQYRPEEFNWLLAHRALKDPADRAFRSMKDPNLYFDPRYLGGNHWFYGSGDFGGVHSNSGVLNHWFFLLVEGATGSNERGLAFAVEPIGMERALQLIFGMQVAYLTPDSDYYQAFEASLWSAEDLFGATSAAYASVVEAWKAVGVEAGHLDQDLSITVLDDTVPLCSDSEHRIYFELRNVGRQEYPAGETLKFQLKQGGTVLQEMSHTLDQQLAVGDSLLLSMDEFLRVNGSIVFVSLEMECSNRNRINDRSTLFAFASEVPGVDLALHHFGPVYSDDCLNRDLLFFRYTLNVLGCEGFPAGDTVYFELETDAGNFRLTQRNARERPPRQFSSGLLNLPPLLVPGDFSDYTVRLVYGRDRNPANDQFEGRFGGSATVGEGFFEDFSGEWPNDYATMVTPLNLVRDSIVYLEGNAMLALGGLQFNLTVEDCPEPADFFERNPYVSRLDFCVDALGMEIPTFALSPRQLPNTLHPPDLNTPEYQVMLRMLTDSVGYESPIIAGQATGDFVEHQFRLPRDYQGRVSFEFVTLSGFEGVLREDYDQLADILYLDNFRLFNRPEDPQTYSSEGFLLYPNPAREVLFVKGEDPEGRYDIRIYDARGRLVNEERAVRHQSWYDTSNYSPGLYYLSIWESGELREKLKFVVVD